jgi:hypothetical protein
MASLLRDKPCPPLLSCLSTVHQFRAIIQAAHRAIRKTVSGHKAMYESNACPSAMRPIAMLVPPFISEERIA